MALDSALPRYINEDIVGVIVSEDSHALYEWLRKMPFVRDGGLKYHPVVRAQILRYKFRNSPQGWAHLHGKLAEYHRLLRDDHAINSSKKYVDPIWQKHALETVYHQLCQAPHKRVETALNQFLVFFEASRRFSREWAEAIGQAGEDIENPELKSWGAKLIDGVRAFDEDRYTDAAGMFTTLLNDGRIDDISRSLH